MSVLAFRPTNSIHPTNADAICLARSPLAVFVRILEDTCSAGSVFAAGTHWRNQMDQFHEARARDLVDQLESAGANRGLLVVQGAVVMRGPGAPYSETLMVTFNETDLQNAIALGLLEKRKVTGSLEWDWYVAKRK